MGYVFEELIRVGAEQANEEAGEHFTPREVIRLMVSLLLSPEPDLGTSYKVKTIYDPACGTGGMLSVAEDYLCEHNSEALPHLYGQDWNDDAWAVCRSDMLIKGENADNTVHGDTFREDGYPRGGGGGRPSRFDYMPANPPFGVEWKQQKQAIEQERDTLGFGGASARGCRGSTTARCCSCSTCCRRCSPSGRTARAVAVWRRQASTRPRVSSRPGADCARRSGLSSRP